MLCSLRAHILCDFLAVTAGLRMKIVAGKESSDENTPPLPNDKEVGSLIAPSVTKLL